MAKFTLNRESVRWLALESIAIVASILLAFAIEAWWQDRQQRNEEKQILLSIRTELADLELVVNDWLIHIPAIRESARKILVASGGTQPVLGNRDLDQLLSDQAWFLSASEIPTPTIDALASTGDLGIISNRSLRKEIIAMLATLEYLRIAVDTDNVFLGDDLLPFMRTRVSFIQLDGRNAPRPGFPNEYFDGIDIPAGEPKSHLELLENTEFQNLLMTRTWILTNAIETLESLQNKMFELNILLENELLNF